MGNMDEWKYSRPERFKVEENGAKMAKNEIEIGKFIKFINS